MMLSCRSEVISHKLQAVFFIACLILFCSLRPAACEEETVSSGELVVKAWEFHGKNDIENTFKVTQECIDLFEQEAKRQQASLNKLPMGTDIDSYRILNDVVTCYFIQGESYMRQEKSEEAVRTFNIIIQQYPFAQAWDPRGWYWQIAKASQESIDKIQKDPSVKAEESEEPKVDRIATTVSLSDFGTEDFVEYTKYGEFKNIGTKDYVYVVHDQAGLSEAVGEGIYPNTGSVRRNPKFKAIVKDERFKGSHWDFLQTPDLEAAFFKWAVASAPAGVRLFYTGLILERAGLIKHAIKCYYAIIVHFPGTYGWTYWHTPWYVGQAAIGKINFLLERNPQFKYKLVDADIKIVNGYNNDVSEDIAIVNPGRFIKYDPEEAVIEDKPDVVSRVNKIVGDGKVRLFQYQNRDWQLQVQGRPYIIRGVTYAPTKVGQSPDEGTLGNWMFEDFNNNNKIDGPYDAFVDKNGNNLQDDDEPTIGDFKLMQDMGVNTIRIYHHPQEVNKELLRELYKNYGIMVIMGDFLGKYALGSGASWYEGTDYRNPKHQKNMIASITMMVEEFKDEPYILFWLLGNENVYGVACNADKDPEGFFKFANEAARVIKSLDSEHPVALCNGDTLFLDIFAENCPDIDIFSANAYRGDYGFGYLWQGVKEEADKPVFITEFGCPAYVEGKNMEESERLQAEYHRAAWEDISNNLAGGTKAGNSIGGVIFEWLDEWWKAYEPGMHDFKPLWAGPFPDGFMHEEWLGVCSQGDGSKSPFLRQ
ncbi:MAG: glycoside hydrolase family 2 TIM barrel-domain containing protein, partial [Candidatus Omnitrophota bacterium]